MTVVSNPTRLEFPSGGFAVTNPSAGVAEVALSSAVTQLGPVIGDVSDESIFFDGDTTDQTCGSGNEGRHRVLTEANGSAGARRIFSFCDGSTTTRRDVVVGSGISDGQTLSGGTTATATLNLNASSDATQRGAINLCTTAPDVGVNSVACAKPYSGGVTIGATATTGTETYSAVLMDSTVTQDTNGGSIFGTPAGYLFRDGHTHQVTDSTLNASIIGSQITIYANPTLKNATDDNLSTATTSAQWQGMTGMYWAPAYVKSSTGTLTCNAEYGLYSTPATIPSGVTVTRSYGGYHKTPTVSGTLTQAYGFFADVSTGTNQHPFAAQEAAITGTQESNTGAWGVETGAPGRFWFRNESGHLWRMGYATWSTHCTGLLGNTNTYYCEPTGEATANTTVANQDQPIPGAAKFYAIACGVNTAPDNGAGTQARIFTLVDDTADTSLTCTISETATSCNGRVEAGVSVAAASMVAMKVAPTGTPAAAEMSCTLWWNLDAF